jgi:hypothetical protein
MEGYQMFTIFNPKKSKSDVKKAALHTSVAPDADVAEAPEKKEKVVKAKEIEKPKQTEEIVPEEDLVDGIF